MAQLNINKSKVIFSLLAVFAALFFGLVSLILVQISGKHYAYLAALPVAIILGLVFVFNRYFFFILVILSRASLDSIFNAIKLGSFGLGAVLNALVILIAILMVFEKPLKYDIKLDSIKLSWIIFLTLAFVSIFYAPAFVASLKVFLLFVSYCSMFTLGLYVVQTQEDFSKWMKMIVYSSFIPSIYAILSMTFGLSGFYHSLNEGLRLQSTFPHPNTYAPYLVIVITVSFYLWRAKPSLVSPTFNKFLPVYIVLLCFFLLMTKTRSTWVACYVFFLLYASFHERKLLLPVLLAPFLALLIPEIRDRVMDLAQGSNFGADGYGRLNSYAWRKQVWTDAINWMSKTHYLFGYGLASFIHYSTSIIKANAYQMQTVEINAHSVYVQLFFELGIFGLLSFLYLLYAHLKALLTVYKRNKLLIFMVIVMMIEYLFMSYSDNLIDYLIYEWYLWFTVGISLSSVKLSQTKMQSHELKVHRT
ncbi:O-antigen ligase [Methylophilus sp. OH31]|uniref:O-antigen ligase family protein n=1 Tax=Methylophilus sp. OH31 TaxID=1387312 RepID=UPI000466C2E9|nr:O-antigen ligase family protein [Methylophilus sp. OH31]